nr:acyltransferase [uncultured Clostridium sp.]
MNFNYIYNKLNKVLEANVEVMPQNFCKWIITNYPNAEIRRLYLNRVGIKVGKNTYLNIGATVVPNDGKEIVVSIGENVSIAPYVTFICESFANNGKTINEFKYVNQKLKKKSPIIVEDEVWIGANVTILPGVHISKLCVIGAGAVVNRDTEKYGIYAGVPAKKIGDIRQYEESWQEDSNI